MVFKLVGNLEEELFNNNFSTVAPFTTSIDVETSTKPLPIDMQFNSGHVVSITVYSLLFLSSAGGNLTVLTAILKRRRVGASLSRVDFLLMHLAIADLTVAFLMMPLEIIWAFTVYWRAGDAMCRIMSFFRIFGIYLTGFVLVCLALDRYLAVRYPMQGLASTKRAKVMVASAWVLSSLCSFPQVIIFHVESHPDFPWYTQCVTFNSFSKPEYELLYAVFGMVMMYALPFILLVVFHSSIAIVLYKISHSGTTFESPVGVRLNRNENIERAKVKSIQMTLVISLVFLLCWTPYYVMCIWYWTDPDTAKRVDQRVQKALFLFASTNSVVNPVVYGLFHMKSIFRPRTRSTIIVMRNVAHLENPTFSYELSYGSQSQRHNSSFRVARDEGWREGVPLLVSHDGANGNSYNNTL